MGNFCNSWIILVCMAIFGQTQALDFYGSRNVMSLQAGIGALCSVFLVWYRFTYLHESEVRTCCCLLLPCYSLLPHLVPFHLPASLRCLLVPATPASC